MRSPALVGLPISPYNLSFFLDRFLMRGGVPHLGGLPGQPCLGRERSSLSRDFQARYKCNNKRDPKIINLNKMAIHVPKKAYLLSFFSRPYHKIM